MRPVKSHAASLPERVHVRTAELPIDTPYRFTNVDTVKSS
jgi:hypothetical protein